MKLVIFVNMLTLGGTEKAACRWAWGLKDRGHDVTVITLYDGPRHATLTAHGIPVSILREDDAPALLAELQRLQPDAIHAHAPGQPHMGDVLGAALAMQSRKIPVVQTNIFGLLQNPAEDRWTDFRLFISWTSGVQAARRQRLPLDERFFQRASVAVYPLDPEEPASPSEVQTFRERLGVTPTETLFGRLSRPDPAKWTNLALNAFQIALRRNRSIKLLLREPPPAIAEKLRASPDADRFVILPATADASELRLTMSSLDVVLHTSAIGESFGYGIAEPMNLGKPVVTHSVPWHDQAQIELARPDECGCVASTPATMAAAIISIARDPAQRERMGLAARRHVRAVADANESISRLESALQAAIAGTGNANAAADLQRAHATAAFLDAHQFGHSLGEQLALRSHYWRVCFHHWRRRFRRGAREVGKV